MVSKGFVKEVIQGISHRRALNALLLCQDGGKR